jgi:hypothetical protein
MAARKLATRVWHHELSYSWAEIILMKSRAGKNYELLNRAENEAARALGDALNRIQHGEIRAHRGPYRIPDPP